MQLKERPGPPGPHAAPDEIAPPRPDVSTGGTRYADIEYARVMGFRPLRMDLLLPPAPSGPVPVVVWIHGGAFLFGSRLHGAVTEPACRALIERGVLLGWWNTASAARRSSHRAFMTSRPRSGGCVNSVST